MDPISNDHQEPDMMKVLMMHRDEGRAGGAQIQMNRLRKGLRNRGVDARVLCREGGSGGSVKMPYQPFAEKCIRAVTRRAGLNDIHLVSSFKVPCLPELADADLLDLHCIHSGTFSYLALPALAARKPLVFTFHDMWPITGHCHASLECGRWKSGCGNCPHPEIEPPIRRDATALEWRLKKRAYEGAGFTIITPSKWLAGLVEQSMLAGRPVHHVAHGLDPDVFKPLEKSACRALLGIPKDKTVLLCAIENMDRPLKGGSLLIEALRELPEAVRKDCVLLVFGRSSPALLNQVPLEVFELGYLNADALKVIAYSAADLLVNPSRAESFGLVALESMACGTPVVAFRVGGIPELVRPGLTGSLAEPEDPQSLADQILSLVSDRSQLQAMGSSCRTVFLNEFTLDVQVNKTISIYESAMRRSPSE
jgi:glycosyltransferase involved in cell wall biosynthesis